MSVLCVMLTEGRNPDLLRTALECYRRQTARCSLILYINNTERIDLSISGTLERVHIHRQDPEQRPTIGALRNFAISEGLRAFPATTHIANMDDDDWSAPWRIADQMQYIEVTGADVVGANSAYFVEWEAGSFRKYQNSGNYILGGSMLFTRRTWEHRPFDVRCKTAEDLAFKQGRRTATSTWLVSQPPAIFGLHAGNRFNPKAFDKSCWGGVTDVETVRLQMALGD